MVLSQPHLENKGQGPILGQGGDDGKGPQGSHLPQVGGARGRALLTGPGDLARRAGSFSRGPGRLAEPTPGTQDTRRNCSGYTLSMLHLSP